MPLSLIVLIALCLAAAATPAQCVNAWLGDLSLPAPAGVTDFAEWDPDGPGPLATQIVAACQQTGTGVGPNSVMVFDDVTGAWQPVGSWRYTFALAVEPRPSGALVATAFDASTMPWVFRVMQWDGVAWTQLGATFDGQVYCTATLTNGDLVVGGGFFHIGSASIANVARWDGASWSALGAGPGQYCDELLVMPNGDLIAAGAFGVSRWDGVAWTSLGGTVAFGVGLSLASDEAGQLYAGSNYNRVYRWSGVSWIVVGGPVFPTAAAFVEDLVVLPNGDLLAADGNPNGSGSPVQVARGDGSTWTPVATANGPVIALAVRRSRGVDLDVLAGGRMSNVAGVAVTNVARWTTSCPPAIALTGSGCPAGGPQLVVEPAWVGGTWVARASGLPQPGFGVGVTGLAPMATPLITLIPQAVPGCALLVAPEVATMLAITNGNASTTWTLPAAPALAGAAFRHQVVAIALGASTSIVSAVATTAATLTVGAF